MVAIVTPWNACEPSRTCWKNWCGLRSTAGRSTSRAMKYNWLACSHISLLICSRTLRAFSRARVRQAVTAFGLSGCHNRNSITAAALAGP
jgi:hypothetical protein